MYKRTMSSQQFFAREAMHSTEGSRRGYSLLDHGENPVGVLTPEEQRDSLIAKIKALETQIIALPKGDPMRRALGQTKFQLQAKVHEIRPKLKGGRTTADHFISVARERLSFALYNAIMTEASRRAQEDG